VRYDLYEELLKKSKQKEREIEKVKMFGWQKLKRL